MNERRDRSSLTGRGGSFQTFVIFWSAQLTFLRWREGQGKHANEQIRPTLFCLFVFFFTLLSSLLRRVVSYILYICTYKLLHCCREVEYEKSRLRRTIRRRERTRRCCSLGLCSPLKATRTSIAIVHVDCSYTKYCVYAYEHNTQHRVQRGHPKEPRSTYP